MDGHSSEMRREKSSDDCDILLFSTDLALTVVGSDFHSWSPTEKALVQCVFQFWDKEIHCIYISGLGLCIGTMLRYLIQLSIFLFSLTCMSFPAFP